MGQPTSRGTIDALTGIRALAAGWVVLYHFWSALVILFPGVARLRGFARAGYVGVDLFFVLSGFIIAYNYLDQFQNLNWRGYRRFIWLRLARIYPVHLFCVLVVTLALVTPTEWGQTLRSEQRYTTLSLIRNLGLVHAWGASFSWNGPAWSISAEWFAYLLFPPFAVVLNRIRSLRLALAGSSLAIPGAIFLFLYGIPGFVSLESAWPLVRILGCFAAGAFACVLFKEGWHRHRNWDVVALVTAATLVLVASALVTRGINAILATPVMPVLILALANATGRAAKILSARAMIYGGKISYALYMTHLLVHEVSIRVLPPDRFSKAGLPARLLVLGAYLAAAGVVAALVYHLVEEPGRRWMRARLATRSPSFAGTLPPDVQAPNSLR